MNIYHTISIGQILKQFASRHRVGFALMLTAVTIATIASMMESYILKLIVDRISSSTFSEVDTHYAYIMVFVLFGVHLIVNLGFRTSGYIGTIILPEIRTEFRGDLFRHLRAHSQRFFSDNFAGSLATKIGQAGRALDNLYAEATWSFYTTICLGLAGVVLLWTVSPWVAIAEISLLSIHMFIASRLIRGGLPRNKAYANARSKTTGQLVDTIGNIMSVINYTAGLKEQARIESVCAEENIAHRSAWRYQEIIRAFNHFATSIIIVSMLMLAIFLWSKGLVSVGDFVMIFTLTSSLALMVRQASQDMLHISEFIGDIRDALEIIGVDHEVTDLPGATPLEDADGSVSFQGVEFVYPGTTYKLFKGLDVQIPPGQRVALVGVSGSGKSTFVRLLLRMYDPQKGAVCVDGHDIRRITQESLRDQIAVVSQEPELFHRTLSENIAYGRPSASIEEIHQAAEMAYADEFISRLPEGYETLVGEKGVKLSGGQKQRIAIARAILKDAPILVFDEATSSLDSESEYLIQAALDPLMRGRTVIAVAHRLSTIQRFDRILVFSDGCIVEDGTHANLVSQEGAYASLWQRQSGGFLSSEEDNLLCVPTTN